MVLKMLAEKFPSGLPKSLVNVFLLILVLAIEWQSQILSLVNLLEFNAEMNRISL